MSSAFRAHTCGRLLLMSRTLRGFGVFCRAHRPFRRPAVEEGAKLSVAPEECQRVRAGGPRGSGAGRSRHARAATTSAIFATTSSGARPAGIDGDGVVGLLQRSDGARRVALVAGDDLGAGRREVDRPAGRLELGDPAAGALVGRWR